MSTAVVDLYCSAWNETDIAARTALLARAVTADVTYIDPTVSLRGTDALAAHIGAVFTRYPGSTIVRTSAVDAHHGLARFLWRKVLADGSALPEGIDIVEFAADGRLSRIIGFFGPAKRGE